MAKPKLSEADERVLRRCGIDRAAFEEEREREEQEAQRRQDVSARDGDGLTAEDARAIRATGVSRAKFLESRRVEEQAEAQRRGRTATGGGDGRKKVSLTADGGQVAQLVADRAALRAS